jgi:hypothetical protein
VYARGNQNEIQEKTIWKHRQHLRRKAIKKTTTKRKKQTKKERKKETNKQRKQKQSAKHNTETKMMSNNTASPR